MKYTAPILLAAALLAAAGCVQKRENPLSIGGEVRLQAIDQDLLDEPLATERSDTSLDRSNWKPILVEVPIDGMANPWIPSRRMIGPDPTDRRRGAYPTPLAAVESDPADRSPLILGVVSPVGALLDLPVTILRVALGDSRTAQEAYEPRQRSPLPEHMAPEKNAK